MKHSFGSKITSLILAALLAIGPLPLFLTGTALAATAAAGNETELRSVLSGAQAGDIIGITEDITLTGDLTVDKNVTLASAGAKIIAGGYRIIIPEGSSVSFGGSLGITGNAATGYNDGLVVVRGSLTIQPGGTAIRNSYSGTANSATVYVEDGTLDVQGGTITDASSGGMVPTGSGIYLNGGYVSLTRGGSDIQVSGSNAGMEARNGANVDIRAGSVEGKYAALFFGQSGGSFYLQDGEVSGTVAGVRLYSAQDSSIVGGTVDSEGCGVSLEGGSDVIIRGCSITGDPGEGGIYLCGGSTARLYRDEELSLTGGILAADGTVGGTVFLSALPDSFSLEPEEEASFSLAGAETVYSLDTTGTSTLLGAQISENTVSLKPTGTGTDLPLVLKTSSSWNDSEDDFTKSLELTIPVTVAEDIDAPTLTNVSRKNIRTTSVTFSASVYDDGGAEITDFGFVYSSSDEYPEIGEAGVLALRYSNGTVTGSADGFTANLSGLTPGTGYYVRAFAVNSAGTGYTVGHNTFSTLLVPEVTTGKVTMSSDGSTWKLLYLYGEVTSEGAGAVTQRGIIITANSASSGTDTLVLGGGDITALAAEGGGAGEYRVSFEVTTHTTYYYRAYATNSSGTSYGDIRTVSIGNINIHVSFEEGGNVQGPNGGVINENGDLYWNGSAFITADTAGHMYFSDLSTGTRLIPLSEETVTGTGTYGAENALYQINIAVQSMNYNYEAQAASGGTYSYEGREYRVTAVYTDKETSETQTDVIVLRSRGVGTGTGNSYFDAFLQVAGSGDVTAIRSDPNWVLYSGMTMEEALAADEEDGTLCGSFADAGADYYMDVNGGADMGGRSYIFRTGEFEGVGTEDESDVYSTGFALRYHGGSEIINLIFAPLLIGETYTPETHGGGAVSSSSTEGYRAAVKVKNVQTGTLPVTLINGSGTGTVSLGGTEASRLFEQGAVIVMPDIGVSAYELKMPVSVLSGSQASGSVTLSTKFASAVIPRNMLGALSADGGKTAGILIGAGGLVGLSNEEKAAVGGRPLVKLALTVGEEAMDWSSQDAPVTVSIPYTPTAEELRSPESIIVWYLDGSGAPVCIPNGRYDAASGSVSFSVAHWGLCAVGYHFTAFPDVTDNAWYFDAVSFLSARGIVTGTGSGCFEPEAELSRAEFLTMAMRAYGIRPEEDGADNFFDAGDTWYTGYLVAAKRLGISKGTGGNLFAPSREITRQEMFTLLYHIITAIARLPEGGTGKLLSDFTDASDVPLWAAEAMEALVRTGIVQGGGGKLLPGRTAVRAEAAQVLWRVLTA